mmetsp:Transcript_21338/g.29894  ORF Transcript_21338/g.29894 Transcript_21338/m.29894 type:complete len:214 (-) Transcript_21338:524-1165(-)
MRAILCPGWHPLILGGDEVGERGRLGVLPRFVPEAVWEESLRPNTSSTSNSQVQDKIKFLIERSRRAGPHPRVREHLLEGNIATILVALPHIALEAQLPEIAIFGEFHMIDDVADIVNVKDDLIRGPVEPEDVEVFREIGVLECVRSHRFCKAVHIICWSPVESSSVRVASHVLPGVCDVRRSISSGFHDIDLSRVRPRPVDVVLRQHPNSWP